MALKQLNNKIVIKLLEEYDSGETPTNLAIKYGVHPTTIRRYLRDNNRKLGRVSHTIAMDTKVKVELRKVLSQLNINDIDIVISELDKNFLIEQRTDTYDEDFKVIHLR